MNVRSQRRFRRIFRFVVLPPVQTVVLSLVIACDPVPPRLLPPLRMWVFWIGSWWSSVLLFQAMLDCCECDMRQTPPSRHEELVDPTPHSSAPPRLAEHAVRPCTPCCLVHAPPLLLSFPVVVFQERITSTNKGSITSVQAVYVPADDLTDPAPATTFAHLDATTVSLMHETYLGWLVPSFMFVVLAVEFHLTNLDSSLACLLVCSRSLLAGDRPLYSH